MTTTFSDKQRCEKCGDFPCSCELSKPETGHMPRFLGWISFGCGKHQHGTMGGQRYDIDCLDCQRQPKLAKFDGEEPLNVAALMAAARALKAITDEAVVLSAEYLETFSQKPLNATIQGWDKARWLRALKAKKRAESALAELEKAGVSL